MIQSILYVFAIVAANMSAYYFGPSITPVNSLLLIGLDLSIRDHLHEKWSNDNLTLRMGTLIFTGSVFSYIANPASGQIAAASCISFFAASVVDHIAYSLSVNRHYLIKSNGSNMFGAATDSVLFPTIAFGTIMPDIVVLQFLAKLIGGVAWSLFIYKFRIKSAQE